MAEAIETAASEGLHAADQSGILFIAAILGNAVRNGNSSPQSLSLARAALPLVRHYQYLVSNGQLPVADERSGWRMRQAIMAFLGCYKGLLSHAWLPLTADRASQPGGPCVNCSLETKVEVFRFRSPGLEPRMLRGCPRCSITADMPTSSSYALRVRDDHLHLLGVLPRRHWSAQVRLLCSNRPASVVYAWPRDESGSPVRQLQPPVSWPVGGVEVQVQLVVGAQLSVVCVRGRRSPHASLLPLDQLIRAASLRERGNTLFPRSDVEGADHQSS